MTCAFAVRGAIKKIPGVESVDVSLNKGLATVKLKPGNTATIAQFWETVRRNGFTPKQTKVVVRGSLLNSGSNLSLKVSGSNQSHDLVVDAALRDKLAKVVNQTVSLEGTFTPGKDVAVPVPVPLHVGNLLP